MSIATRIESIETHLANAYDSIADKGIDLEDRLNIKLSPSEMTQEDTPTPDNPQDIHTTTGDNVIRVEGTDYPLTLGTLEYSKIGNYEDEFIYNTTDTNLELGKWYLKKNIGKVVLDGSESWMYQSVNTRFVLNYTGAVNGGDLYCNHYIKGDTAATNNTIQMSANYIYIKDTRYSEIDNYENWLSNNNTIVDFIRTNPEYLPLNDTLQTQLDAVAAIHGYGPDANISQTNEDAPFIIDADFIHIDKNIENLSSSIKQINENAEMEYLNELIDNINGESVGE